MVTAIPVASVVSPQSVLLIQEEIPVLKYKEKTFDIRALVQKNKSGQWEITNTVSRLSYNGCFNTSMCDHVILAKKQLNRVFPEDRAASLLQTIHDVSLEVAECIAKKGKLHVGELSVDFGVDQYGKAWIIEVNGQPQKKLYNDLNHGKRLKEVYRKPIEYAQYLASL